MLKSNALIILNLGALLFLSTGLLAQTGINTKTPNTNAVLDVFSNEKGILIPRLTDSEVAALAGNLSMEEGMVVYNKDQDCIQVFVNTTVGFVCLTTALQADVTKDIWVDDPSNLMVKVGTTTSGAARPVDSDVIIKDNGNVGVGTTTPNEKLHVAGGTQLAGELNVGGDASLAGSPGTEGQLLTSGGPGAAPSWKSFADIVPTSNGTVIAVNGKLLIAQEITAQLSDNYSTSSGSASPIQNLSVEIIDNENTYSGTDGPTGTNFFKVKEDGLYEVVMNMQLRNSTAGTYPVIGIWDNTAGEWVARVNDYVPYADRLQTFTLITTINMLASKTYSFRAASDIGTLSIRENSGGTGGTTGTGKVSQVSVKRLR